MTLRWAVANGNWSNPVTWDGGTTVPGVGDEVHPNNFVVNIDVSISVDRISNKDVSSPAINSGGRFTVSTGAGITLTIAQPQDIDDVQWAVSDTYFFTVQPGSGSLTINCPKIIGAWNTNGRNFSLDPGYTGAITINGSLEGGWRGPALYISTGANPSLITINGDVKGSEWHGFSGNPSALIINGATTIHIYGDVVGGNIANFCNTIRWFSAATATVYVHGEVRGGPLGSLTGSGCTGIELTGASVGTNYLYVEGNITGTIAGSAIICSGAGARIRASGVEVQAFGTLPAITIPASSLIAPAQISGLITSMSDGRLAIQGIFVGIAGEPLEIVVRDDVNYPTNMNGNPVTLTSAVLGTDVLVDGNAAEVEVRADGMMFTVAESDPDHVMLGMPSELDFTDVPELSDQINEVFAPPSALSSTGWLTVTAQGILGMADTADMGGAPDYVPVVGTVTLTPNLTKPIRRLSTEDILMVSSVVATFDSNGEMTYDGVTDVRITAPLWTDLSVTTWKWVADVRPGPGQSWAAWTVLFTGAPGATVNLAALIT